MEDRAEEQDDEDWNRVTRNEHQFSIGNFDWLGVSGGLIPLLLACQTHNNQAPPSTTMPAPSRLQIATSSLERLLKEEASYHRELEQGEARIRAAEQQNSSDENADYVIRQEVLFSTSSAFLMLTPAQKKAVEETKAVFPSLHKRIKDATTQLEQQLVVSNTYPVRSVQPADLLNQTENDQTPQEEAVKSSTVLAQAKALFEK
jgi:tubulin-specific chaperone A